MNLLLLAIQKLLRFLLVHPDALLATDDPLAALAHQRVRCMFCESNILN
jgi:hypothetical protein